MGDVEEENHTSQSIDKLPSEEEEFGGIPKSSINQIVKSVFAETAEDSSIEVSRISQEARDAMATCGVTFIRQITDESFSLFSESSSKKTMSHDYIIRVLNQHGLNWVSDKCLSVAEESKVMITAAKKRKSGRKLEALGIPYEELLRQQEALIEEVCSVDSEKFWLKSRKNPYYDGYVELFLPENLEACDIIRKTGSGLNVQKREVSFWTLHVTERFFSRSWIFV